MSERLIVIQTVSLATIKNVFHSDSLKTERAWSLRSVYRLETISFKFLMEKYVGLI
jgi:hypothetical protein